MGRQLARLVCAQVVLIVYAILSAGVFLKIRYGTSHPAVLDTAMAAYDAWLFNHGIWLFVVPIIWSAVCYWKMRHADADADIFTQLYISGIMGCVLFFFVGVSTLSVLVTGEIVVTKDRPADHQTP